ncbi:hypothetical protein Tco_0305101 [Tanacetum coccineum]
MRKSMPLKLVARSVVDHTTLRIAKKMIKPLRKHTTLNLVSHSLEDDIELPLLDSTDLFIAESSKRHDENNNLIKEIHSSTNAALRNQGASIKELEIQIGQLSKILHERGSGGLPSSTEANLRHYVKCVSTYVQPDQKAICRMSVNPYDVSDEQDKMMIDYNQTTIPFPIHLCADDLEDQKELNDVGGFEAYFAQSKLLNDSLPYKEKEEVFLYLVSLTIYRSVKHPKVIVENVLVRIERFVFHVDFIVLDVPEDIKTPLILGRPFLSTAHAKIDVYKRKITLRVREDKIVFTTHKPTSNIIRRVYALGLLERMRLNLEARIMGKTLVLNRSQDLNVEDMIELIDLNEPIELRQNQVHDLGPTIYEGDVVDEPINDEIISDNEYESEDFDVVENMDIYRDEGMGEVICGIPFSLKVGVTAQCFLGKITIEIGHESVTYYMANTLPNLKHLTNAQYGNLGQSGLPPYDITILCNFVYNSNKHSLWFMVGGRGCGGGGSWSMVVVRGSWSWSLVVVMVVVRGRGRGHGRSPWSVVLCPGCGPWSFVYDLWSIVHGLWSMVGVVCVRGRWSFSVVSGSWSVVVVSGHVRGHGRSPWSVVFMEVTVVVVVIVVVGGRWSVVGGLWSRVGGPWLVVRSLRSCLVVMVGSRGPWFMVRCHGLGRGRGRGLWSFIHGLCGHSHGPWSRGSWLVVGGRGRGHGCGQWSLSWSVVGVGVVDDGKLGQSGLPPYDITISKFNTFLEVEFKGEGTTKTMTEPTMEEHMTTTREDYGSGIARLKFDDKANFELKGQILKELRTKTFSGAEDEDPNEHIEKVLEIADLFHIPNVTQDQVMLRAFPMSLTGAASRWLRNEPSGSIQTLEALRKRFLAKQILDSKGAIPSMKAVDAKIAIQEMADHLQKWHKGSSTKSRSTKTSDGLAAIQAHRLCVDDIEDHKELNDVGGFKAYFAQSKLLNDSLPHKEKDQGSFSIPCFINNMFFSNALVDLGANVSVMPYVTYTKLGFGSLVPTKLIVELADRSMKHPKGIVENVLVRIERFVYPLDFIVLDVPKDI